MLMDAAVRADAHSEFPIYATIARSFLMQEHRVELRMREALIQEEIKVLQEEHLRCLAESRAFEEKVQQRSAEVQKIHEQRLSEEGATEAERIEQCVQLAHAALEK